MILHKFPFGPLQTNTILFVCPDTRKAIVFDPAQGSSSAVLKKAEQLQARIEKILITHAHWDHIADVHVLKKQTQASVYIHPFDVGNLERPGSDGIPLFGPIMGVKPDFLIQEGDEILLGKLSFTVLHTPGHSPGSVCYHLCSEKLLISGDTLFEGSIGNLSLPTAQPDKMWISLQKLAQLPSETHVVPGHGRDTTIGREHWLGRAKELFN
jgi:glyoxylase-like metal-dependent hydrolase (beta-lactamase superfamily II)